MHILELSQRWDRDIRMYLLSADWICRPDTGWVKVGAGVLQIYGPSDQGALSACGGLKVVFRCMSCVYFLIKSVKLKTNFECFVICHLGGLIRFEFTYLVAWKNIVYSLNKRQILKTVYCID